ncbi:MAG: OmpA family protein [Pseudomonadota bacterium]
MKPTQLLVCAVLALTTAMPSLAAAKDYTEAKKGMAVIAATTAGVALGGPLGLVGGGLIGAWIGNTLDTAASAEAAKAELAVAQADMERSERALAAARAANEQYAQLVLDQLQLEMLFKTGASELSNTGQMRLVALARFLKANPMVTIRLDGFADPRGNADFNQQLSEARVEHVAARLAEHGINSARIQQFSHGDSRSVAKQGDYDAYALERAVRIELSQPASGALAASQ